MDKRYQVFVSSTFEDLKEERQEVIQALLELDCFPAGMELFPAADEDQWSLIQKVINDCDYYVVIIGGRYGSTASTGVSYTQMEYEYAVSSGKPVIAFLHRDPGSIASSRTEQSETGKGKLIAFRELVQKKVCKYWTTPAELGSVISRSLVKLIREKPAVGWVRSSFVPSETVSKEMLRLREEIDDLRAKLNAVSVQPPAGTEGLARGAEMTYIRYEYERRPEDSGTWAASWDELFGILAPRMINEASEVELKNVIRAHLLSLHGNREEIGGMWLKVDESDFQTVKIQLRALGLIQQSKKQHSLKDTNTYWSLTPFGDHEVSRIRAVKSGGRKN